MMLIVPILGYACDCRPEPDLTIFFTSDTRGMLRRCGCTEGQMGGLSARASYIKTHGTKGRTLVLDAGDTFFPGLEVEPQLDVPVDKWGFYSIKAATIAKAMNAAGYNAAAVGEFDLALGPVFLLGAVKDAGFPFLAANSAWDLDGELWKPFVGRTTVTVGGVNVGLVGVLGAGFPYRDFPENFDKIIVSDTAKAAQREIDALKGKVDLVIVLSHLSIEPAEDFVRELKGANVVIQGHSGEHLEAPEIIGCDTVLVKGYMQGKYMGRLDLWLEHDPDVLASGKWITCFEFSVAALDESVPPDEDVERIIAGYRERLKELKFKFERPDPEGVCTFTGPEACKQCHPEAYANWSSTRHAHSFSSLEATSDQYDPECLLCHTTGFGFKSGYRSGVIDRSGVLDRLANVTCEVCHGRGSGHVALKSGRKGERDKDEITREVPEDVCIGCHDEEQSPYFDYGQYLDMGGAHRGAE